MVFLPAVLLVAVISQAALGDVSTTVTTTRKVEYWDKIVEELPSLKGKCVAFTGANAGIGYWAAVGAAKKSPSCLIMMNRPGAKSEKVQEEIAKAYPDVAVYTVDVDLSVLASVRAAAETVNKIAMKYGGIDALGLNAGTMNEDDVRTGDGLDITMEVDHLSQFLLTKLLMPSLQAAAGARHEVRIVTQSSAARGAFMGLTTGKVEDKFYLKTPPDSLGGNGSIASLHRYHQAKMANVVFAMAMHSKFKAAAGSENFKDFKALAVAPGATVTDISIPKFLLPIKWFVAMDTPDGATPLLVAMFSPEAKSGDFYEPAKVLTGPPKKFISEGVALPDTPYRFGMGLVDAHLCASETLSQVWNASEVGLGEKFVIGPGSDTLIV